MALPKEITLDGKGFAFVSAQRAGSSVYRSGNEYLRIGPSAAIDKKLALHRQMEEEGFPIPEFLREGAWGDQKYFVERSLGESRLSDIFAQDVELSGKISDEHFDQFLDVVGKFLKAQLKAEISHDGLYGFAEGVHIDILCAELPDHAARIRARFDEILGEVRDLPGVLSHGDFNPANMYPAGIIDFEDTFRGPLGYDIVSAVAHIDWFPDPGDYEYFAHYRYTPEQIGRFYEQMDALVASAGFDPPSKYREAFEFCRGAWSLVRMRDMPRLQGWRYQAFIKRYLSG